MKPEVVVPFSFCTGTAWIFQKSKEEFIVREESRDIPMIKFNWKSASLLLVASLFGGAIMPYIFYLLHWDDKLAVMIFLPISLALVLSINQYFFNTKQGFGKRFVRMFLIASLVFALLAYVWLYQGIIF